MESLSSYTELHKLSFHDVFLALLVVILGTFVFRLGRKVDVPVGRTVGYLVRSLNIQEGLQVVLLLLVESSGSELLPGTARWADPGLPGVLKTYLLNRQESDS